MRSPMIRPSDSMNSFQCVVLTGQRARQLAAGARPRVDATGHKPLRVALLEVSAGLVSWIIEEKPVPAGAPKADTAPKK
jgi:DNA-directed RNA polymerase subunit K/omega